MITTTNMYSYKSHLIDVFDTLSCECVSNTDKLDIIDKCIFIDKIYKVVREDGE